MNKVIFTQILFAVLLGLIIGIEFAYRDPLYNASLDIIINIQSHATNAGKYTFIIISYIGAGEVYFIIFFLIYMWEVRSRAYYYISFICITLFVMNLTKIAYHDPRPYMSNSQIEPWGSCSKEYGNPSGHSLFAAAFFPFFFLDHFHGLFRGRKIAIKWYGLALFFTVAFCVLIGFARLYVGLHSLN
jgi:membrane-associated phospholipid phosphatase